MPESLRAANSSINDIFDSLKFPSALSGAYILHFNFEACHYNANFAIVIQKRSLKTGRLTHLILNYHAYESGRKN